MWNWRGGAYKTQTVKGLGVSSPEEEIGRGFVAAVMEVSVIVGVMFGCLTNSGLYIPFPSCRQSFVH